MRAGSLDRVISLQRLTKSVNDAGTVTETWTDLAAAIRAALVAPAPILATAAPTAFSAVESDRAYGPAEEAIYVFRIRYVAGVTTADRVIYAGEPYVITGMTELGRRRGLDLRCRRVS